MVNQRDDEWFACPSCGKEVRVGSKGCRTCSIDDAPEPEWREEEPDPGLADIPAGYGGEDDFDYNEFLESEFNDKPRNPLNPVWIAIGLAIFLVLLFLLLTAPVFGNL